MKTPAAERSVVNLRRAYFECRYGQLHVRTAFPSTGGFDERTALVVLHDCPHSSRVFVPFLGAIGTDRSVYAADTPGYGQSDPPPQAPVIADYAAAIADFLGHLRLRQVDVLGYQAGAAIAAELAIQQPAVVRRLVLASVPVATTAEREAFRAAPFPAPPAEDGRHALAEWQRAAAIRGPGMTLGQLAAGHADALANGANAAWWERAALAWASHERLPLIAQPTLVLRPRDRYSEQTLRAQSLLKHARLEDLATFGEGLFEVDPAGVAARVRGFLDG